LHDKKKKEVCVSEADESEQVDVLFLQNHTIHFAGKCDSLLDSIHGITRE